MSKLQELFREQIETEGSVLTFRVYKAHGQTLRLQIRQAPNPNSADDEESLTICEEDVSTFVCEMMKAVQAMGTAINSGLMTDSQASASQKESQEERMARIRKRYPNAYQPWTKEEDEQLRKEVASGIPVRSIAKTHGRYEGAIGKRLEKLAIDSGI